MMTTRKKMTTPAASQVPQAYPASPESSTPAQT
jgi:hypothetical protein